MDSKENDAKINLDESSSGSQATVEKDVTTTQADEKSAVTQTSSNDIPFHEHPRFKEIINEKNQLRAEVEALKRQTQGNTQASQSQSLYEMAVQKLVKKGMDQETASDFVQDQMQLMQAVAQQNVAPLYQAQGQLTLNQTLDLFEKENPDYNKYKGKMFEVLSSMSKQDQDWIMSNLPRGIEHLYSKVKKDDLGNIEQEQFEKGKQEAYEKKREKSSVSKSQSVTPSMDSLLDELRNEKVYDEKTKAKWDRIEAERLGRI